MRLAPCIHQFFHQYLPHIRGMSHHTIQSYRDAFKLFLPFAADYYNIKISSLRLNHISTELIIAFLQNLEQDRKNIMNTRLFNTVAITILPAYANVTDILIEVHERWYFFPIPIFSLADRNLNDWIQNQGADWSRVSYGIKMYKNNSRGRNERLRLDAQFGYTKRFLIQYQMRRRYS